MTDPLKDATVTLGVTGSIAAYKALSIASRLVQAGARVDVILTRSAREMVRPIAFQALTHRDVVCDLWQPVGVTALDHIALARSADVLLIAPATADVIARLALGRADDALATTALATTAPILLAPAMEPNMWAHPATRANVATLVGRGAEFVGPDPGRMASGVEGVGRLADPERIVDRLRCVLARHGRWSSRRVLVTAGPTREPIDPVRFLSNHSSGRMGYALAVGARDRGADVTLVSGPTRLPAPEGVRLVPVGTAAEMAEAVLTELEALDALLMTAAVADYRPAEFAAHKIKKSDAASRLDLVRTTDILAAVDRAVQGLDRPPVRVGYAAETRDLVSEARRKLVAKGLDLIVANPVPESFDAEASRAVLVDAGGEHDLGRAPKAAIAEAVLDRVERMWTEKGAASARAESGDAG